MSILNKFIKKKTSEESKSKKEIKEQKGQKEGKRISVRKKDIDALILIRPRITEKAADLAQQGKYIFEVANSANKIRIKEAVKSFYNVKVKHVRIINVSGKKRRLGLIQGATSGYKKAIVALEKGEKIEILPR